MSRTDTVRITSRVRQDMIQHTREDAPLETCALLLGAEDLIDDYYPMTNTDESEVHFTIQPDEQLQAMKEARRQNKDILGVFHSHPSPDSEAYPSEEDRRRGWPEYVYFILNLQPDGPVLNAFRLTEEGVADVSYEVVES